MPNDSSTGGYLSPAVVSPPTEDSDLDNQLQALVVGITGLDATLVRPRWQQSPPKQPEATVNWCAIGVTTIEPDATAAIIHHPAGNGTDEMQRHDRIEVLASFYGPGAYAYAAMLRDGLQIAQNREALLLANMALGWAARITSAPELINQTWVRRADIVVVIRRAVSRTYAVENLLIAQGVITGNAATSSDTEPFEAGE